MSNLKQTFTSSLLEVGTVQREVLGTLRQDERGRWYKYVQFQNSATVAAAAGDQLVYFAATGYLNNRVCSRAADGDATLPFPAGVPLAAVAGVAATIYFIWMQIKGQVVLSTAISGAAAAGKRFTGSTVNATFATCAAATDPTAGVMYNATVGAALDCSF